MNGDRWFTIRQLLIFNTLLLVLMVIVWTPALWQTGSRLDYRNDQDGGFVALRVAPEAGLSYQWSDRGDSIWFWTPGSNRLLWVIE